MQVTQAAKGQSAFFRTNNGGYGTEWDSKQGGVDTADPTEVPKYAELVSLQHPITLRQNCKRIKVTTVKKSNRPF